MRIDNIQYLIKFSCFTLTVIFCFLIMFYILWGYLKKNIKMFTEIYIIFTMKDFIKALWSSFYHPEFQLRLYMSMNILLIVNYHYPFYYPTGVFYLFEDYYAISYDVWDKEDHVYNDVGYTVGFQFLTPPIYDVFTKNDWVNTVLTNYF